MKTASQTLIDFLNSSQQMTVVDLYTFSIFKQSVDAAGNINSYYNTYRYCTWDRDVTIGNATWSATGLLIDRDRCRLVLGVEVDTLNVKVNADDSMTVEGQSFLQAATAGVLDGGRVLLERAFVDGITVVGTVNMFGGRIAQVKTSRTQADITVNSDLELLNIKMPRNLYQPSCQHTLYGTGCGANRASFDYSGLVNAAATTYTASTFNVVGFSAANGLFDLGTIIFKTGALAGTTRTIKSWSNGFATLVNPLPQIPADGDAVVLYPGCDKTLSTCTSRFNNAANFRGFPFVPVPETMR